MGCGVSFDFGFLGSFGVGLSFFWRLRLKVFFSLVGKVVIILIRFILLICRSESF